jgi:hypothetical protein
VKVFGIGLNKTGTISLHEALETLGLRSLHWGGPEVRATVERAFRERRPLVDDLPDYDAYSDIYDLSARFALLARQYPGSRFILTTRDLDGWIESRRRHVERNRVRQAAGEYHGTFLEIEPDVWAEQFRAHHEAVEAFFADRDDLLVMRITEGDGYEVLCPFLGLPDPGVPFPSRHRGQEAEALVAAAAPRPPSRRERLLRRTGGRSQPGRSAP